MIPATSLYLTKLSKDKSLKICSTDAGAHPMGVLWVRTPKHNGEGEKRYVCAHENQNLVLYSYQDPQPLSKTCISPEMAYFVREWSLIIGRGGGATKWEGGGGK